MFFYRAYQYLSCNAFILVQPVATMGCIFFAANLLQAQPINRKQVIDRHAVKVNAFDSLQSLSVGNGAFAFTVDATGLQTFPDRYLKGIPLGTQSEWGWHSFPNTENFRFDESLKNYPWHGRHVSYGVQWKEPLRNKKASDYFRQNPHRLHLGHVGFELIKKDGSLAKPEDITGIQQKLDMWTGEIESNFQLEGVLVKVKTISHQERDAIGVEIHSDLLLQKRIRVAISFPYPTGEWADAGNYFEQADKHSTTIISSAAQKAVIMHQLDTANYYTACNWQGQADIFEKQRHRFVVAPKASNSFSMTVTFSGSQSIPNISFQQCLQSSHSGWIKFWQSGGAVDFSGSTDERAMEIERRVVLSQYLTKLQCAGNFPPQETGLTYNSWFGKPHLEMHWWHGVHFALWGRPELLEKSMQWYFEVFEAAKQIASRQGYAGVRWQKMVDHAGNESPSSVGSFLIWQQPHFITFAELLYRSKYKKSTIEKYSKLVFATADFMADYVWYDSSKERYILGPGLIPAQERFNPEETFNPTYELHYWYWALETAQQWRLRLGMSRNTVWDKVLKGLSPLPVLEGVYLGAESAKDSYTNPKYLTDHPAVLGTVGMLPASAKTDSGTMRQTFDLIWKQWTWNDTWGWDFPLAAMTATRLHMPQKAVEALLMPIRTNTYLVNGHNYQDERLRLYLPGNGGVLAAVALMLAGFDGCTTDMPGIPKDGKWKVKWEGLQPMH